MGFWATAHYSNELLGVGRSSTLEAFRELILTQAEGGKVVYGPKGRSCSIYLPNGEWVRGMSEMIDALSERGVKVETEVVARKKREIK